MNEAKGIMIKELAIQHGSTVRDNKYYYDLYGDKAFFAENIIEDFLVRDKRFVINPELGENATTLAIAASKKVLEKAGLTGNDIDLICFCTFTGESTCPPGALVIHHEIGGNAATPCFDFNANCIGMVLGFEQISKYMAASNGINRALLVGAECLSMFFLPDDIVNYVSYGDTACAVILEKTDDESKFIDTSFHINSDGFNSAAAPKCGLTNIFKASKEELHFASNPQEIELDNHVEAVKKMLREHNLTVEDIKLFCVSQFSKQLSQEFLDKLNVSEPQRMFVVEKFGYTGANSPFLVLHEAIKEGKVERGDYIVMWTIGAGTQAIMSLLRY